MPIEVYDVTFLSEGRGERCALEALKPPGINNNFRQETFPFDISK